jgi:hypothetical protein
MFERTLPAAARALALRGNRASLRRSLLRLGRPRTALSQRREVVGKLHVQTTKWETRYLNRELLPVSSQFGGEIGPI